MTSDGDGSVLPVSRPADHLFHDSADRRPVSPGSAASDQSPSSAVRREDRDRSKDVERRPGAPVFTVEGRYQARGWTEWTQGFQFGSALLQFDATGDARVPRSRPRRTIERMAPHLTHMGVHDHGFNNVSTYGNLWRLAREGRIDAGEWEVLATSWR